MIFLFNKLYLPDAHRNEWGTMSQMKQMRSRGVRMCLRGRAHALKIEREGRWVNTKGSGSRRTQYAGPGEERRGSEEGRGAWQSSASPLPVLSFSRTG